MTPAEYHTEAQALRHSPMVEAWIKAYRESNPRWHTHADCHFCGFPHSKHIPCHGAAFGHVPVGGKSYSVDYSNVVFFHQFRLELGKEAGFHWRDDKYFKRLDDGSVQIQFVEEFNGHPNVKSWVIPSPEWASIVCSVSEDGESNGRWDAAQDFHGRPE
jgi:hypothetical protein